MSVSQLEIIHMCDVFKVIDRMVTACCVKNTAQMLKFIGVSSGAAGLWKKRGKVPDGSLVKVSERAYVRIEWLKTGQGEMHSDSVIKGVELLKLTDEEHAEADKQFVKMMLQKIPSKPGVEQEMTLLANIYAKLDKDKQARLLTLATTMLLEQVDDQSV